MRYILAHPTARQRALEAVRTAPDGVAVDIRPVDRTVAQNDAQWPILRSLSRQVQWPINGVMVYMTPDDWKDVLTAAFTKSAPRIAQGLDGGMVLLGARTHKFSKPQFSEWLDFLHSVAAERGVKLESA